VALLNVLRPKWIVAGCESQSHTTPGRPVHPECFRMVRNWCAAYGVPFYLKQMEVDGRLVHEPELDGVRHLEIP
jgi:protein gp37